MEHNSINSCIEEWETLSNEYRSLEKLHKLYQAKLEEVNSLQQKCIKGIVHQRYRLNIIKTSLKRLNKNPSDADENDKVRSDLLQTDLLRRKAQLYEMENILPKPSGRYLKIILGNINVSILDKNETFRYKDEYEKFKLVMSLIALGVSIINCLTNVRTMDVIHMFLLVWYYCTLTIRESILKVNGSRMKGWWRAHHFISTVLSGVMLIWPVGECYYSFRTQFMAFNMYISFVQYLQFMYQRGCLYRLKALGQSHNMDITVDGFQSWMWKGLSFLLPFLFVGYFWELYHAYTLYNIMSNPGADWHVGTLCVLFFILFLGNCLTTAATIPQKLKERFKLKYRFTRLDKYIWTHKKRRVSFRNPESAERRTPAARAASFSRTLNSTREVLGSEHVNTVVVKPETQSQQPAISAPPSSTDGKTVSPTVSQQTCDTTTTPPATATSVIYDSGAGTTPTPTLSSDAGAKVENVETILHSINDSTIDPLETSGYVTSTLDSSGSGDSIPHTITKLVSERLDSSSSAPLILTQDELATIKQCAADIEEDEETTTSEEDSETKKEK